MTNYRNGQKVEANLKYAVLDNEIEPRQREQEIVSSK